MTAWPALIVIARAVAESIPPDRRTTAVSAITEGMRADAKGLASRSLGDEGPIRPVRAACSQCYALRITVEQGELEEVLIAADAGHDELVSGGQGAVAIDIREGEAPVRK